MPRYDFECEQCAYYAEITQSMDDPAVLPCPVCEQPTMKKVFINPPSVFVRGDAKTVGQLAERNYNNMGFYEKSEKKEKDSQGSKLSEEQQKKRKLNHKINSMTPEQKIRWIKNGD
tara:strand:- start:3004 stop:3351 length:348 start_codon:yes stop_codon:yes gene_type:complete